MKGQLPKHVVRTLRVFTSAMHWYERNLKMGCKRGNFSDQSLRLWDACAAFKESEKRIRRMK